MRIPPESHLDLVREYAASVITVRELAALYGYNHISLYRIIKGYSFRKPIRHTVGRRMACALKPID